MKKFLVVLLIFVMCFAFTACGDLSSVFNSASATHEVTFLNYDNTLLYKATGIKTGEPAVYDGPTPTKPSTSEHSYSFIGWDKDISAIYSDLAVFAQYDEHSRSAASEIRLNDLDFENLGKSMQLNAYVSDEQSPELELYNVGNFDDEFYVFYYDLGLVKRAPIYTSLALEYGQQDLSLKLTFQKLSEESLETSISEVTEKIDTHSYTGGFDLGFKQEVAVEAKLLGKGLNAKFTTSQSTDHHWTNNWGTVTTNSETTKNAYVSTYSEGYEINLDVSEGKGFKRGYSYRVSFYETIRCYGVLYYDIANDKFTVAYETMLLPNNTRLVIEESTDARGEFDYGITKTIDFDVDKAIALARKNMPQKDDSIHIKNYQEFYRYMNGETADKTYVVDMDTINLTGELWAPFREFKGVLDGNGCEIINWNYKQVSVGNIGLFESNSGTIKNFTFRNCNITNDDPDVHGTLNAGILCGVNYGVIDGVSVKNSNIAVDVGNIGNENNNYVYVGMLCGLNYGVISGKSEISNCEISAYAGTRFEGSRTYVGGAVGYSAKGSIGGVYSYNNKIRATSKADVKHGFLGVETGHGRPYSYVGGIVGYSENTVLENSLRSSSNDLDYDLARDCDHSTNKGGGKGNINGNA